MTVLLTQSTIQNSSVHCAEELFDSNHSFSRVNLFLHHLEQIISIYHHWMWCFLWNKCIFSHRPWPVCVLCAVFRAMRAVVTFTSRQRLYWQENCVLWFVTLFEQQIPILAKRKPICLQLAEQPNNVTQGFSTTTGNRLGLPNIWADVKYASSCGSC